MLKGCVLITGGTSGLGKELVMMFLKNGFRVVATGRHPIELQGFEDSFGLFRTDFSDLRQTAETINLICKSYKFDLVINNAGILSPPAVSMTKDGNEYTFQVNYLAHLMINEMIISNHDKDEPLRICTITSPVYRLIKSDANSINSVKYYYPLKAYTYSKFLLAMMCRDLPAKYPDRNLVCCSFNPGVFSSGIYRMQSRVFGFLYKIAAPFMTSPSKVAGVLFGILTGSELKNRVIYDIRSKIRDIPEIDNLHREEFRKECYSKINPYMGRI